MGITPELKSHLLNLYHLALSDSEFAAVELATLHEIATQKGLSREEINEVILNPSSIQFEKPHILEDRIEYLFDFAKIILADGQVTNEEMGVLKSFCLKFDFEEENIDDITDLLIEKAKAGVSFQDFIQHISES